MLNYRQKMQSIQNNLKKMWFFVSFDSFKNQAKSGIKQDLGLKNVGSKIQKPQKPKTKQQNPKKIKKKTIDK